MLLKCGFEIETKAGYPGFGKKYYPSVHAGEEFFS